MMKKQMTFARGLTGALSVSALALGLSGGAQAALVGNAGGMQGTSIAVSGAAITANTTVMYNSGAGGNNGNGVSGVGGSMGGAAGPFAPASSINITYSRHNLGSGNKIGSNHTAAVLATNTQGTENAVVGTNQICVFCHTPHGFNVVQSGPLWNKQVNSSAAYTVYNAGTNNSSTLDADAPVIGSVSLACLSCHDGTQAMDNMINAPGSGGMAQAYDATNTSGINATMNPGGASGVIASTPGVSQGYVWGNAAAGSGFAYMGQGGAIPGFANGGDSPASEGIDLGTDLSNDHPISVQYCGGGILTVDASYVAGHDATGAMIANGTCNDRLFNLPTTSLMGGQARFWVDTNVIPDQDAIDAHASSTGGLGANPITRDPDTLEVYVTDGELAATSNPLVVAVGAGLGGRCGTGTNGDNCGRGFVSYANGSGINTGTSAGRIAGWGVRTKQDIMLFTNNKGVTGPSVECASCHDPHTPNNGTFLRVSNNQSGLCVSCHVK